jgi:pyruvate,water dikinase
MSSEQLEMVPIWDMTPGLDFNPKVDLPEMHSWFLDATHSIPPWTPLYGWQWINYCARGTQYAAAELSIPTCKGWVQRFKHGGSYNSWYIVRDKKEIAEREVKYRQALRPWIEDFDGLWAGYKKELLDIYHKLMELDVDNATSTQLYRHSHDLTHANQKQWEIHFLGMYASYNGWLLFEQMAKERFGLKDTDPEYQDMMRGFPNKIYDMDRDLWQFGQLAVEMGLGDVFKKNDPQSILAKLQQSEKGKEWFKKFMHYMETDDVGGWRMRRFNDLNEPYWLEDPATPIGVVKDNIIMGAKYALDATQPQLARKRDAAIANFLRKVPADEKDLWEGMIRLSGRTSAYSEEHGLYCELMVQSLMRRGYMAIGRRLARAGTIDQPEDIFMLIPDEIDRVIFAPEFHDMRWITRRRRAIWEAWQKTPAPPVITDRASFEEAVVNDLIPAYDAIAIKIVVGEQPTVKPELKADMWGLCGCAGEAEGTARVCFVYDDLKKVQPGDILVCPASQPSWTPVYSIIKGVITDSGGTLCHAAIIGREYGIPTIVRTMEATQKIKSGQRIKIDATRGAVYLLSK